MKKSYKLSKNEVDRASFDSYNDLIPIYKKNKKLLEQIKDLKKKGILTDKELLDLVKRYSPIPISIFRDNSPLEALVKYLKENLNLSLNEIASLINRDPRTIWITYNNSKKSIKKLDINSKITIPLNYFAERQLSILENLVDFLVDQGYSLVKISALLNRNYKTTWTIYKRVKEKDE